MWKVTLSVVICKQVEICTCKDIYVYSFVYTYVILSAKLTLSACVWRWSCTRYTGADVGDVGGSGAA